MPTYQYVCTECAEPLEVVQSFNDAPLTQCPNCSGQLRKVFSAVGVVFKGSGFYRTDSRDSGSKAASKVKKPATTESTGSKSTDSSPKSSGTNDSTKSKTPAAAAA